MENLGSAIFQGFTFVLIFAAIIFLAIITTRFIGGKAGKTLRGKNIQVVETVGLGLDKQLHLIRAGNQYVLIATAGKSITYLTALKENSVEVEDLPEESSTIAFKSIFDKTLQAFKTDDRKDLDDLVGQDVGEALKGDVFKSNLKKLKSYSSEFDLQVNQSGDDDTNDKR